jgi:hypothetical protein
MDRVDSRTAADIIFRRGYVPVSEIPTTATQQTGIAIIFLMTALAFVTWGARMYSRSSKTQIGIGEFVAMLP